MANTQQKTTETVRYANVKALYQMLQRADFAELSKIKECRKQIDALISELRRQENEEINRLKQEEEARNAAKRVATPEQPAKETVENAEPVKAPVQEEESKPAVKTDRPADSMVVTRSKTFTPEKPSKPSYVKGMVQPHQIRDNSKTTSAPTGRGDKYQKPPRPLGTAQGSRSAIKMDMPTVSKDNKRSFDSKKKDYSKSSDDKKQLTKRTLIRKGFIPQDMDDDQRMGTRKLKNKKPKETVAFTPIKIEKAVITTENLTVKILSEKIGITAQEIIKKLMSLDIITTINSVVDFPTMELVANEFGVQLELKIDKSKEEQLEEIHEEIDAPEDLVKRPPIVTVMGHVDHGKTSLLDAIRKTSVASGEAGGITQHIGAYSVKVKNDKITFLDTPGHEAFTAMRARGAAVTDIAILIVAADDGVMPQTVEAIRHIKAVETKRSDKNSGESEEKFPVIVAINKIDKPNAKIDLIKQQLADNGLLCEEWGGDTMLVPISAKTGQGIDKLLENILFIAEYNDYRANPKRNAKATIVEARLDKGKGPVANIIVTNGTLKVGDYVVSGTAYGKVRAMIDDKGRMLKEAEPSTPVSVLGFTEVPSVGDVMFAVNDEKMAKAVVDERKAKIQTEKANQGQEPTALQKLLDDMAVGEQKSVDIIIKGDVQGSVEAIKNSLLKLNSDEIHLNIIHSGVGAINKSDLMFAEVTKGKTIVVGFNVRPDSESKTIAESKGIDIRLYKVIYEVIEDIEREMKGLVEPKYQEVVLGRAQVRSIFKITGVGMVAGSFVTSGKMVRNAKARVIRDGNVIFDNGVLATLKRFKDDAKEVAKGYECGINIADFSDYAENDEIEAYELQEIKA